MGNSNGHDGPVNSVAFFGTNHAITGSDDATIKIWNIETGKCIKTLQGSKFETSPVSVVAVVSERDKLIVSGSKSGTMKIWYIGTYIADNSLAKKSKTEFNNLVKYVKREELSPSQILALGVQVKYRKFSVNSLAIDNSGTILSGWEDGRLWTKEIEDNGTEHDFMIPTHYGNPRVKIHEEAVNSVAMNETYIVSGSTDKTIGIWYANNGKFVKKLEKPRSSVMPRSML